MASLNLTNGADAASATAGSLLADAARATSPLRPNPLWQEHFRQVLRRAPIVIWQLDAEGTITLADGSGLASIGILPELVVGQNVFELYHDVPHIVQNMRRALAGEEFSSTNEFRGRVLEGSFRSLRDAEGRVVCVLGLAMDVTDRVQAEDELRQAHAELERRIAERTEELSTTNAALKAHNRLLKSILDRIADGVVVCDAEGKFLVFNPAAARMMGTGSIDVEPSDWPAAYGLFLPDRESPFPLERLPLMRALRGEEVQNEDIYVRHERLKAPLWLNVSARPIHSAEGSIAGAVAAFRDVTEAKESRDALQDERRFLEYSLAVHERDRQLMAYEMHDGLVQKITAAAMYVESVRRRVPGMEQTAAEECETVLRLLRGAMQEARLVISGLRPPILDELGVPAAIEYLIHEQMSLGAPSIEFAHDVAWTHLEPLLEAMMFRIVQEALTNLRTHSQARHGWITLEEESGWIKLTVRDDGIGFVPREVTENRFGLQGIRKRISLLRGRFELISAPGTGTTLVVELPRELGPARVLSHSGETK